MKIIDMLYPILWKEFKPPTSHYPSACRVVVGGKVYGTCLRQLYYKWTGKTYSNPIPFPNMLKMFLGNVVHEGLQNILVKLGVVESVEKHHRVNIEGLKYPVGYKEDAVLFVDKDKQKELMEEHGVMISDNDINKRSAFELKTVWGRGIDSIMNTGAKVGHILQIICYMTLSKMPSACLFYIGISGLHRQFDYEMKDGIVREVPAQYKLSYTFADIVKSWKELEVHLEKKVEPARDYFCFRKGGECKPGRQKSGIRYTSAWNCMYCNWRDSCWKDVTDNEIPEDLDGKSVKKY